MFISKKEFYETEFKKVISYLTIFLSNIFSKEIIYKKAIKELTSNYSKQLELFLCDAVQSTREIKQELYSKGSLDDTEIQQIEESFNLNLLETTVLKSLAIIFSKIILISDSKTFNIRIEKLSESLFTFLEKNSINFLSSFNLQLDYDFLSEFNRLLQSPQAKEASALYQQQQAFAAAADLNAIVNIKSFTKALSKSDDEYFYGVLGSLDNLSYSFNYFIDLKELYVSMKTKSYNMLVFFEFFEKLFEYNFSLCRAEASVSALTSISHLYGIICSIGFNDTISSTYLFSDNSTLKLANSKEKKLAEDIMQTDKETFIKVNFDLIRTLYASKLDKFLGFFEANMLGAVGASALEAQKPLAFRSSERPTESFYSQYYSYKYDILFYVLEYLRTQFNLNVEAPLEDAAAKASATSKVSFVNLSKIPDVIKEENEFATLIISYAKIHAFLLNKSLLGLVEQLGDHIRADSSEENEKCILSIINLIHSQLTFLVITGYQLRSEADLDILNNLLNSLMSYYNSLHNYSNTIILIVCTYMNLTSSFIENFAESEKIIANYIPLLEANRSSNGEYTIIRTFMRKLKKEISNTNFLILLQFLNSFVKAYGVNAIDVILSEKILLAFILNDPFENSFSLSEYQENERSTEHILWCWLWSFFKQCLLCVSESDIGYFDSVYSLVIEFILNHERRVFSVLGNSEYSDSSGNTLQKSLAFVEELECVSSVICLLFVENRKWRNSFYEFYMRVVLVVIEKSLKLYIPNVKISNHFKCYSTYEHRMNEVIDFLVLSF